MTPLICELEGLRFEQTGEVIVEKPSKIGLWLSRFFCGIIYLIMKKLRFLCFASLLAMVFALLLIGDSPTMATEDPPPSSSASITITMTTPPLPE